MERRQFLKSLAIISSTAVLDPEKLLWVPGKKKIFDLYLPTNKQLAFLHSDCLWIYYTYNTTTHRWVASEVFGHRFEKTNAKNPSTHS